MGVQRAILDFLKMRGGRGARVPDVRAHLSEAHGFNGHAKTPGMALQRLRAKGCVTNTGRVWFFVCEDTCARSVERRRPSRLNGELRLCGYCSQWWSRPCGNGCHLSAGSPTWEETHAASAIEAQRAATVQQGAAEGESAAREAGDAQ